MKPRREREHNLLVESPQLELRSARQAKRLAPPAPIKLVALFALSLFLTAPASADDLIAQWLQQNEASGQTEEVRADLNAITDEQWKEMFTIGREQPDAFAHLLVGNGRSRPQVDIFFPVGLAILTAVLALLVGGIKGRSRIRREFKC
jgi:hypothetical protein